MSHRCLWSWPGHGPFQERLCFLGCHFLQYYPVFATISNSANKLANGLPGNRHMQPARNKEVLRILGPFFSKGACDLSGFRAHVVSAAGLGIFGNSPFFPFSRVVLEGNDGQALALRARIPLLSRVVNGGRRIQALYVCVLVHYV